MTHATPLHRRLLVAALLTGLGLTAPTGCRDEAAPNPSMDEAEAAPITNRVPIPAAVRRNLGIEFATVDARVVEQLLRVPGRFELLPTAIRDHQAPVDGRVELLVDQFDEVEAGTPLYRISGGGWVDLRERLATARARLDSMEPIREAHRVHERSLAEKVALWQERLDQLGSLRAAGGGNAAAVTDARATLNATQAQLAEVMEKDAELAAGERVLVAEVAAIETRLQAIGGGRDCADALSDGEALVVCASTSGVVERLAATPGSHLEEGDPILTIVQPERLRVRARVLQSDLAQLRDGLDARIASPTAAGVADLPTMRASIRVAPTADGDGRTIDVFATPETIESWARAGVAVALEIVLAGGRPELAVPRRSILDDGGTPILFRRDPADPNTVIRLEGDLGRDDGRWVEVLSGVAAGDEVVVAGNYQLLLATSDSMPKGGHFHADGTYHAEDH